MKWKLFARAFLRSAASRLPPGSPAAYCAPSLSAQNERNIFSRFRPNNKFIFHSVRPGEKCWCHLIICHVHNLRRSMGVALLLPLYMSVDWWRNSWMGLIGAQLFICCESAGVSAADQKCQTGPMSGNGKANVCCIHCTRPQRMQKFAERKKIQYIACVPCPLWMAYMKLTQIEIERFFVGAKILSKVVSAHDVTFNSEYGYYSNVFCEKKKLRFSDSVQLVQYDGECEEKGELNTWKIGLSVQLRAQYNVRTCPRKIGYSVKVFWSGPNHRQENRVNICFARQFCMLRCFWQAFVFNLTRYML